MKFRVEAESGRARAGVATLPRGTYNTPVFMPVGTQATVKAMSPADLQDIGASVILSNAYHLHLRPGCEIVEGLGGLHKFMQWPGFILTDSGGYQVFSLNSLMKLTDEGVEFKSHIDGSRHFMRPEDNMAVQRALGSDLVMALDECPPADGARKRIEAAVARTTAWAARCKTVTLKEHQTLVPIVQGGIEPNLRRISAESLMEMGFTAYAIGGLSVGEERAAMLDTIEALDYVLPRDCPRYLMGVGMPEEIFAGIERGVDMFDCVLPTRMARNGTVFTSRGRVNLRNARFKDDASPVDADCECYTCRTFSRAYLRHLFYAGEIMGPRLATFHNLFFYVRMTRNIRRAILEGTFDMMKKEFFSRYNSEE